MFVEYDANVISLLVLAVVYFNNIKNGGEKTSRQRLFRLLVICDMLLLVIDALLIIFSKEEKMVHLFLRGGFIFLSAMFCFLWAFFCTYRLGRRVRKRGALVLSLPLAVLTVFFIVSGSAFLSPDVLGEDRNRYAVSIVMFLYAVYSWTLTAGSRKKMQKSEFTLFLIIPALPIVIGLLKPDAGVSTQVVWPCVAIGLLLMQLSALDTKMNTDHLTGLYNRKHLDDYITDILENSSSSFAALMIDIDNFKTINDNFGHVQGDRVLISASQLLKKSVRRGDFVARYGGDEFMIVLDRCSLSAPERIIGRIRENFARYGQGSKAPYALDFSVGYKVFPNPRGLTLKELYAQIDALMYKNKQSKTIK